MIKYKNSFSWLVINWQWQNIVNKSNKTPTNIKWYKNTHSLTRKRNKIPTEDSTKNHVNTKIVKKRRRRNEKYEDKKETNEKSITHIHHHKNLRFKNG